MKEVKEGTILQSICRNILAIHNQAPSDDKELDEFLEAVAATDLLRAFSDELLQHWHLWKKEQQEDQKGDREQERAAADTGPKQESTSTASQDKIEAILADFQDIEDIEEVEEEKAGETEPSTESTEPVEPEGSEAETIEAPPDNAVVTEHTAQSDISQISESESTEPPPVPEDTPADQDHQKQETHSAAPDPGIRHQQHLPRQSNTMKRNTSSSTVLFKLPNAMINIPYSEPLAIEGDKVIKITRLEGLEATGMSYNPETRVVE
ncbi:MAG: hypothetical protein D3916_18020, partial [Candidatus Electrothrix sp. MAN1_4]|nr:hypothetical protein [Candidatus Electrothrix sp. MAN1_4]